MPRRAFLTVALLLALLHLYIGWRLIPPMRLATGGAVIGMALLAASILLVATGLFASNLKRFRWAEQLTWAGLLAMGFFSSLLVLTVLRDVALLALAVVDGSFDPAAIERASAIGVPLLALAVTLVGLVNALYDAKSTAGWAGARAMRPAASGSSACTRWTTSGC